MITIIIAFIFISFIIMAFMYLSHMGLIVNRFSLFRRYQIKFKGKNGFQKKILFVAFYLLFGFVIISILYILWFNEQKQSPKSLTYTIASDDIKTDRKNDTTVLQIVNPTVVDEIINKRLNKYRIDFNSFKIILQFFEEKDGLLGVVLAFYGLLAIIIGFYEWNKFEVFALLFNRNQERIKILRRFSQRSILTDSSSIYNAIISLLNRCEDAKMKASKQGEIKIKMLLCSPLIDYEGRVGNDNYSMWGQEFVDSIHSLVNSSNKAVDLELFHLPNQEISGINPLRNFTEVLANFYSQNTKCETSHQVYEKIWERTQSHLKRLETLDSDPNQLVKVNRVNLFDVPFQIIIAQTPLLREVIVFFAGRRNIEIDTDNYENSYHNHEPYGFQSVDDDVVEAFEKIFNNYVQESNRKSIKPEHTVNIINSIENEKSEEIKILSYLYNDKDESVYKLFDSPIININIKKGMFSPCVANSSKFLSRVIQSTISKSDIVLDIGAGSGIQSIVSYNSLVKLGNTTPIVYAIEMVKEVYELFMKNVEDNGLKDKIIGFESELICQYSNKLKSENNLFYLNPNNPDVKEKFDYINNKYISEIVNGEIGTLTNEQFSPANFDGTKFTFILADLPFVNYTPKSDLDKSFFDYRHNTHKTLFQFFKKSVLVDKEAKLLTTFSSLGGYDDLLSFEQMINECGLSIIKKISYIEEGFEWLTYVIIKKEKFVGSYWWDELNVKCSQ